MIAVLLLITNQRPDPVRPRYSRDPVIRDPVIAIVANGDTQAAIHKIVNSDWKNKFSPIHIEDCEHYQIMFYDETYDVLCRKVIANNGKYCEK